MRFQINSNRFSRDRSFEHRSHIKHQKEILAWIKYEIFKRSSSASSQDAQTPQSILSYTRTKTTATAEKLLPFTLPFSCRIKILFTRIKDTFLKRGYYARRMQLVHLLLIHTVIFVDKLPIYSKLLSFFFYSLLHQKFKIQVNRYMSA